MKALCNLVLVSVIGLFISAGICSAPGDQPTSTDSKKTAAKPTTPATKPPAPEVITSMRLIDLEKELAEVSGTVTSTVFFHKGQMLVSGYGNDPDNWVRVVELLKDLRPCKRTVRHYDISIQGGVKGDTITWEKRPGYSVWKKYEDMLNRACIPKPTKKSDGDGFYISKNNASDFVAIRADSAIKAGLLAKELKPDADPKLAEKAVGPFEEYEADRIVEQFMTRPVRLIRDDPEADNFRPLRVSIKMTKEEVDKEVEKVYGKNLEWEFFD